MRRLLIVGRSGVASRLAPRLRGRCRIDALAGDPRRPAVLRALGVIPIPGDLDRPESPAALAGLAHEVAHFAPPPGGGARDTRGAHLIAALGRRKSLPQHFDFLNESRRLANGRVKRELRLRLRYPMVHDGVPHV